MEGIAKSLIHLKERKFRVFIPETLFPPDFSLLNQKRCPTCTCLLKYVQKRDVWMCKGKKHVKPFIVTAKRMREI